MTQLLNMVTWRCSQLIIKIIEIVTYKCFTKTPFFIDLQWENYMIIELRTKLQKNSNIPTLFYKEVELI